MQYRIDQKSNTELSALGFGCMRFPKDLKEAEQLVIHAVENGINYFDTAYIYGNNEVVLGNILAKNQLRKKIYIATKLPAFLIRNQRDFDKYFQKELERLQTNYLDYYLIHMLTDLQQWKKLCDLGIEQWIAEKKKSNVIRRIGFSFHGQRNEFEAILDAYDWEFCQIQYNYSDENYQAGVSGLKKAAAKGIPVIIMEPLLGGKLANELPEEAQRVFHQKNPNYSPAAWALRWLWNQPEVTVVLSGMNELSQLEENIHIANQSPVDILTQDEIDTIKKAQQIFRASFRIPCTGCEYCMPCPQHINIPACFSAYNISYSMGFKTGMHQYMFDSGAFAMQEKRAGLCIKCRKCESHCPQEIKISEELKLVKSRMEPWWYRFALTFIRIFLGKKNRQKEK